MLRADLHVHTSFSPDAGAAPEEVVTRCQAVGLSCIAVTDHDAIGGALETQRIAPFRVIVGEEVSTRSGDVVGLFLKEEIPPGLPAAEVTEAIKAQGGLVLLPHPFDRLRPGLLRHIPPEEVLPFVDVVEVFNARTWLPWDNAQARKLAEKHHLAAAVGSDAHSTSELGHTYLEMPDFDGTPAAFLQALERATLVTRRTSLLHRLAARYGWLRRLLGRA